MEDGHKEARDGEIGFFDYLSLFVKHRKLIVGITFFTALVALVGSLLLPPIYRAETKILPPQQGPSSMTSQLFNQLSGIVNLMPGSTGIRNPNDMYVGILKSRSVFDKIVDTFDLMKVYDVKYKEDARRKLDEALVAKSGKDGIITISVEDRDPKRAAEMANTFVEELKFLSKGLAITEAAERRLFFEEQLADVKKSLMKAEEEIKDFQEETGALNMDYQAKAVIEGIARIRAQISAKEVQQKVLRTYATSQNPLLQRTEEELKGLQAELRKLEEKSSAGHDPLMSTGQMPSVGVKYIRILRDVKYNETLYELLAKQFEVAKLDEARDAVVFQVIDKAVTPEKKIKPKRTRIVIIATVLGLLFSFIVAFFKEYYYGIP